MPDSPVAFLSYTRLDNEAHGGAISEMRRQLELAVRAATGEPFEIFQDEEGIGLGEDWQKKLDDTLAEAMFLIAVITPTFFNSTACRDELEKFLRIESERGSNDRILPLYFIGAPHIEREVRRSADPLASAIHARQYYDWRKLRIEHPTSHLWQAEVHKLAEWIAEAIERAEEDQTPAPSPRPTPKRPSTPTLAPLSIFREVDEPWCPEMVIIPPGRFWMGSPDDEPERRAREGPRHEVIIERPFLLGRHAVTFDEYDAYCEAGGIEKPGDNGWGRGRRPAINVSWEDAQAYLAWLNAKLGLGPSTYRLPSEAEWEYACRAGTATPFWTGRQISTDQANYNGNHPYENGPKGVYRQRTVAVGELGAAAVNPFGLAHMHGNVWEWCDDHWHDSYDGAPRDGSAWLEASAGSGALRVFRGGSWSSGARDARAAIRYIYEPDVRLDSLGFRCARVRERA